MSEETPTSNASGTALSFAMGDHHASFPIDRFYTTNHMWAMETGEETDDGVFRFGMTAYAVRLLQDVYFLDWVVEVGMKLANRANLGSIESKKAESDLYAPLAGTLTAINETALDDPSIINAETYGDGWLIEMRPESREALLTPEAYLEHLETAWDVAQRTIKGQANE